jgi:geranylgeranyl diphosphate synthase type II
VSPATAIDGRKYLEATRLLTDRLLDRYLPSEAAEPRSLHTAMRYSVMAGGKRLRPILALAAYEFCHGHPGRAPETVHRAMAALEMVHTYSLIHDDLPCMDDDDLRRGIPTCHKKFGEAVATLAGDALHVLSFELMASTGSIDVVLELAEAVGTSGMLGGQMADIEAEGRLVQHGRAAGDVITREEVENIHRRKTGALIRGSVRIGAILAGADRGTLDRLTTYGEKVGLAFQIVDDLLDIEGDQALLGKKVGSDSKNQKATYPGAVGIDKSRRVAAELIDGALAALDSDDDNILKYIARFIGQRER